MTVYRLLHLAIIHEASNYIKTMIDLSRNTEFLNVQNDQRQVCVPHCALVSSQAFFFFFPPVCRSKDLVFSLSTQTPLHLAVITNQANVCLDLLVSGCDPTLVDDHGDTPLHIACRHGNLLCFSVITQNCQPEHLCRMMAACNYQGETLVL